MTAAAAEVPEGVTWSHVTRTFQALGHRFAIRSTDAELGRLFDRLYEGCAVPGSPATWYSVIGAEPAGEQCELYVDGSLFATLDHVSWLVQYVTWHVNQQVVARSSEYVLLHAAAATRDSAAILLPAEAEAGKTTLVAGLVRSGFGYLTDEAAAIDPMTLEVVPYPKPLSIDPGSWATLSDLSPTAHADHAAFHEGQWQVQATAIRTDAVSDRAMPLLVVFPSYTRGARTQVEPVSRADAVVSMMRQTFRFNEHGRRNLAVLGRLAEQVACYRLVSGQLDEACAAVESLVDMHVGSVESARVEKARRHGS